MAYSFRLKEFGNGTLQLTYYHNAIRTKDDLWKPYDYFDIPNEDNENDEDDGFYLGFRKLKSLSPFDLEKNATQLTLEDEYLVLSEEELQDKKEHSIRTSLNRSKRMIYDYGRSNVWEWFFTLTFKPVEKFDKENYSECSRKVRKWFKNIRNNYCPNIKYLIVPEQHESGAWHFHALVSNCDGLTFVKAVNNQEFRKDKNGNVLINKKGESVPNKYFGDHLRTSYPDGEYIYNIAQYKNGFSTATKIIDTRKAVSYVVKYMTKELCECTFGMRRYLPSMNLELPNVKYIGGMHDNIDLLISEIAYNCGAKLSIDYIKSYKVDVNNYQNTITIFECSVSQKTTGGNGIV